MKKIVCLMLLAGMLGACNATREDLGLERKCRTLQRFPNKNSCCCRRTTI